MATTTPEKLSVDQMMAEFEAKVEAHPILKQVRRELWFKSQLHLPKPAKVGADGGGRTHTSLRIPDFESSASANSATSATRRKI